jgi:hypothetical protein
MSMAMSVTSVVRDPRPAVCAILKARGSAHDPFTRRYEITTDGVISGDQFDRSQSMT